ncbi:MAG: hypothetical protein ACE5PV_14210 [Candidatus Poribacteria bacterium]
MEINNAQKFVDCVTEFADNVAELCRDKYGEKKSLLLADGVNPKTGAPLKWEKHILSNLACQQNYLRTLDGLTAITGEMKYRKRADEWIEYALSELQDAVSGMLYWGGHTSYDILEDRPLIGNHELKCVYPYYPYLYKVDSDATQFAIEGFWHKHIKDWSNLLFNRHGEYRDWDRTTVWEHEYKGSPLPIIDNSMLSFINTGSDLIYAGATLFKLSGDEKPLLWAKRLLKRYDEIRNETTGLGGYQFNHREPCRVRISFKKPLSERGDVNETTVITNGVIQSRYGRAALTWMNLFEELGVSDGQDFLDMVVKDLTALGKHSYDEENHSFIPLLVDGMKLSPEDCMEGVGYCSPQKLKKVPANGLMLFAYAKAYRLTKNAFFWQMVRSLAIGMGLGEIGDEPDSTISQTSSPPNDTFALCGLLELYKATDQRDYLALAANLGKGLAQASFVDGFFTMSGGNGWTKIDSSLPVALLHLAATIEQKDIDLPTLYPNSTSFDPKVIIARR